MLTGTGAVTSVGRSVAAACAAIHAGVSRPRPLNELRVVEPESQEDLALSGHPVHGYTEGFTLLGRWMRLARGCVRDLVSSSPGLKTADRRFWDTTGLTVIVMPPDDTVLLTAPGQGRAHLEEAFLLPLHSALELPIPPRNVELLCAGHAGTALAIEQGVRRFSSRELERLLIVAVDSYIDTQRLAELLEQGRLKTEEQPVGLIPGEAGVALLLEAEPSARRRNAPIAGYVAAVSTNREPEERPRIQRGHALAECLARALDHGAVASPFRGDIYSDLNGEAWRAQEWGRARIRLEQRLEESCLQLPCTSVGDVGAASGALGVCLALCARDPFRDAEAPSLVLSSSDRGEVGCLVLQPARLEQGRGRG
ncbi:hypothetical protein HPC49_01935 [Pyxidicoccus fallax]|uniref:Beta-ketoacyl synthase N-terminal domain-containing protein n=1 Tax=Pyxidicoccus fallax TaxID=394095 RepID=A0A848LBY0_9BACT|nr:hypothetical protein [Pyxidicoccus fallax]NMO13801.1 hypothetical protein [Pyxidicoccus fallax]NPC77012.1 hypothetical protein [Pyxidicoccus fallax]